MILIRGHSDDVVCIEGDVTDETSAGKSIRIGQVIVVSMHYMSGGVWGARVRQAGDGMGFPWPVAIVAGHGRYSVEVRIDCPPGTPVSVGGKVINPPKRK